MKQKIAIVIAALILGFAVGMCIVAAQQRDQLKLRNMQVTQAICNKSRDAKTSDFQEACAIVQDITNYKYVCTDATFCKVEEK